MRNVMLKIRGVQNYLGEVSEPIELITEGKFYNKDNAKYLVYEESEISGMVGCTTTLKVQDDKIVMKRFGSAISELVFQKGKRHTTNYSTPYGNFKLEILTKKLDYQIRDDEAEGKISLIYDISIQGLKESSNSLDIEIKPN